MTLPQYDSVLYKTNFVDQVIIRVDFLSPIKDLERDLPLQLSQSALSRFPIAEPRQAVAKEFQVSANEPVKEKNSSYTEWHFHGRNREKSLVILPSAIFISYKSYTKYEIVREDFLATLKSAFDTFKQAQPSRLGLRYINKITLSEPNPLEWARYINNKMLCLFSWTEDKAALTRLFHTLEFAYEDFNLRYQFGMQNPDFPAKIRQKIFTLDLDAYHQGPLEYSEIGSRCDAYHAQIQHYFEVTITDALREKMNA
ncbi:MAG: TIGR04255 family protein [Nitrospiraceae bacterium]